MSLTRGALARICAGEEVPPPNMQVLGYKKIAGSGQERYRILLSDGENSNSFSMLATQLNPMIHNGQLEQFTIIKVDKYICNQVQGQSKRVVILLEVSVVTPGEQVGEKIGNPQAMGGDGSTKVQNQNANPNAGGAAQAVKRPNEQQPTNNYEAKKPMVNEQPRTSVLNPRPSVGAGGGGMYTPIDSITPYQNKWQIKARVTSKSDIRTWNNAKGSGKLFSMDLMDESGEIRATAFKEQCDMYYDMIQVGRVFLISNCQVKAANKQYSKLRNDYELTFKDNVIVQPCDEDTSDVPTIIYNFMAIGDLSTQQKDAIVDIIGICKSADEAKEFTSRAGKEMVKRDVIIVDKSAHEVSLTLWGNTARNFDGGNFPVLAVKGARVSDFNGITLSGGDLLTNPDMPQGHEVKGWWDNEGCNMSTQSLTVQGMRSGGGDGGNMMTFGEVKATKLGTNSERGEYYSVVASVTFFSKEKTLYKACTNQQDGRDCNKKVTESGDGYRCEKCAKDNTDFRWRMMLSFNLGDATDNSWASCFQEQGERLLGVKSDELGYLLENDEEKYNAIFAEATFKTWSFRMRAKEDNYNDETRLKHTVVSMEEVNYEAHCKRLIQEIEKMGGSLPDRVNRSNYM